MAKRMLGLAFTQRAVLVAEVSGDGKSSELLKSGEFELPPVSEDAAEVGKKFAAFLKAGGFSAKQAVAGLPTQWMMLKEKSLPAVSVENLSGMLLLQSERDFSLEPKDLVLDFSSTPSDAGLSVLLAATSRERVERCKAVALAAGVTLKTLTSSALEIAREANVPVLIYAGPNGADLIVRTPSGLFVPAVLSSSSKPENATGWASGVGMEARRILTLRSGQGGSLDDSESPVALWNGAGLSAADILAIKTSLGHELRVLTELGAPKLLIKGLAGAPRFATPATLAARGVADRAPGLNFLASKLIEKKPGRFGQVKSWMWAAALLAIGLFGALSWSWINDSREFATLKKQAASRKAEVDAANVFLTRYDSAEGWYDQRPNILECMKAMTRVLPADGSSWISNLSMKEDFHCVASLKATDTKVYFDVFEAIDKDEAFRDVKLVYMTQPDKKKSEVAFAVSFVYWKQ